MNHVWIISFLFFCCVHIISSIRFADGEDDIDDFVEKKVAEKFSGMLKDYDRMFELHKKIIQNHETRIKEYEKVLLKQTKKFEKQEKMLQEYKHQVTHLTSRIDKYENAYENDSLYKTFENNDKIQTFIGANDSSVGRTKRSSEGVAFNAQLTIHQDHVGLHQIIKYDKVHLNNGVGYNRYTGIFTAPHAGVYMFAYFFAHDGQETGQAWLALMHNSKMINAAVSDINYRFQDTQGGNFAFIQMAAGDSVWIESWHASDAFIDGSNGFTTFSGALLF